jgi:hypothetical protein
MTGVSGRGEPIGSEFELERILSAMPSKKKQGKQALSSEADGGGGGEKSLLCCAPIF